jgi:DNA polymerase III subunit delta'
MRSLKLIPSHSSLWNRFELNHQEQRLAHAILLIGARYADLTGLAYRITAALFCKNPPSPCGQCQSCQLIEINEHPDLNVIQPDKLHGAIKIEQIRLLQYSVFTSPQLGKNRVVIIEPAEKMNAAAANALLKILEEPPQNTYFLLIAEHLSTIAPTILSRCQQWRLSNADALSDNYLLQGAFYPKESGRGQLFAQLETIVNGILDLQSYKISVNSLAAKWAAFEINDLLWLLYLINSQMICDYFNGECEKLPIASKLYKLAKHIKPVRLFNQLDKLNDIIKNLNHTISMNQLLLLEEFLLGYL